MTHLFRPVEPPKRPSPPVGSPAALTRAVAVRQLLARAAALIQSQRGRRIANLALLLLGLVLQTAMLLWIGYLIDLSVSLFELWAELARKHLELTL